MNPKVVYDCMIFLQALVSPSGPAFACFELVEKRLVTLLVSPAILLEVQGVLNRTELQVKFPLLVPARIQTFLTSVSALAQAVISPPSAFPLPRDPKDEPYLDLAIAGNAAYLVTWNRKHLTYLMDQNTPEGREFCNRYPALRIVDPPEFLKLIEARHNP